MTPDDLMRDSQAPCEDLLTKQLLQKRLVDPSLGGER